MGSAKLTKLAQEVALREGKGHFKRKLLLPSNESHTQAHLKMLQENSAISVVLYQARIHPAWIHTEIVVDSGIREALPVSQCVTPHTV